MPKKEPTPPVRTPKGAFAGLAASEYREVEQFVREHVPVVLGVVMRRRGLTIAQLGEIMGLSPSAVKHRLSGRTEFSASELVGLARYLGLNPAVFYDPSFPIEEILRRGPTGTGGSPADPASSSG